jgi:hypothetical protein
LAGLLLGFTVLIRAYMVFVLIGPFIRLIRQKNKRFAIALAVTFFVVIGGWMTRNFAKLGAFTFSTQGAQELWCGNNAWARGAWPGEWVSGDSAQRRYLRTKYPGFDQIGEVARSRIFVGEAAGELFSHPARILWLIPRKAAIYFSPFSSWGKDWVYLGLLPFSIVGGIALRLSKRGRRSLWLLGTPIIAVMIICLFTFGDPRFRHPVDSLIVILSSVGITYISRGAFSRFKRLNGDLLARTSKA